MKAAMPDRNNSPKALARNLQKILRCLEFGTNVKTRPVLTITQMRILSFFNDRDIIHVSDISRRADMSIQSVNNLISRLEIDRVRTAQPESSGPPPERHQAYRYRARIY